MWGFYYKPDVYRNGIQGGSSPYDITKPANGEPVTFGNGTQISFLTKTKEQVEKFHQIALGLGATNEGNPGFRPHDSDVYYAYVRDPDGNKICSYTSVNV